MQLIDQHKRVHKYLRISLTDNCNFRCSYCMPDEDYSFIPPLRLMSPSEIFELAQKFVELGVNKIRLTGGEPLIRKEAADIITLLSELPVELTLTTNGVLLPKFLPEIKAAGMQSVNISLDTLDANKFLLITKRDYFTRVMDAIHLTLDHSIRVKINVVVMKGVNDDEILKFIEWTKDVPVQIRFIEFMPFSGNQWDTKKLITLQQILEIIHQQYSTEKLADGPNDTAKQYAIPGHKGSFALISTMTHPFCNTCDRLRLTADGKLKNCLFSKNETDLLGALRNQEDITPLIMENLRSKAAWLGGQFDLFLDNDKAGQIENRSMISIGG